MVYLDTNKEIIFASSNPEVSRAISRLLSEGKLRKIAPKIYSSNLVDSPESIVRRNILHILMWRFPGTVISHRSAHEMRITPSGDFFLTGKSNRNVKDLPGVTVHILKGPEPDEKDMRYGNMFIASEYRWMLENMQQTKKEGESSKILPQEVVEKKLGSVMIAGGEDALNDYRDQLRATAQRLGMDREFKRINILISAILATHSADILTSPTIKAMAAGAPYDENRKDLFETLFDALQSYHFLSYPVVSSELEYRNIAFYESYFSNYIEGTEFEVDEARRIVETGLPAAHRSEDSHDILGTFNVVSNRSEMQQCPESIQDLKDILQRRHAILLSGRPDLHPGQFKERNNRAGNTEFVDFKLVPGTLDVGFSYYAALSSPMARAVYMMFLISETHPFDDGNGRVARMMMNAELFHAGEAKIIVPTVCREDYLLALRKLSRQKDPSAYLKVMDMLHRFTASLYGRSTDDMLQYLYKCNAFSEPDEQYLKF